MLPRVLRTATVSSRIEERSGNRTLTKAILLLSGGIDSATALYLTKEWANEIYSINMVYAGTYDAEAEASKRIAAAAHVKEHLTVLLPFFKDIEQRYHPAPSAEITPAYVPARNIIFYGIATAYAETLKASTIVFGSNADDAKELPDARSEFIQLMNELILHGTRAGREGFRIEIVNPLIHQTKGEVLKLALKLKVPLELTWSCYEDGKVPCGKCRGCIGRRKAFQEAAVRDPLLLGGGAAQ
jgi:7-cyano-7-deazaguanine synthase